MLCAGRYTSLMFQVEREAKAWYIQFKDDMTVYMDRSYRPEEIAKDVMPTMNEMLDYAEREWTTRKEYDTRSDGQGDLLIEGLGLSGRADELKHNGWQMELVTNNFTNKTRIYIFHPRYHLLGRASYAGSQNGYVLLDFLVPCKDFKKKYRGSTKVYARDFIGGDDVRLTDYSVEQLLNAITAKLKSETPKKKAVKKDNVIDIVALLAEVQKREQSNVQARQASNQ